MNIKYAAAATLMASLLGCGTTEVSPAIAGKPGINTEMGQDGYPVFVSVQIHTRTPAAPNSRLKCVASQLDDIEAEPVADGESVIASAKSVFFFSQNNRNQSFRYTVTVSGALDSTYTFERLRFFNAGTQGGPLMASKYWSPENVVAALEAIADRIDSCVLNRR